VVDTNKIQDAIKTKLKGIGLAYVSFLETEQLKDTHLARMAYFSEIKKAYVEAPIEPAAVQKEVIRHLDVWMSQTNQAMTSSMPPVPESFTLFVARKRS
jgi:hypothetical protein